MARQHVFTLRARQRRVGSTVVHKGGRITMAVGDPRVAEFKRDGAWDHRLVSVPDPRPQPEPSTAKPSPIDGRVVAVYKDLHARITEGAAAAERLEPEQARQLARMIAGNLRHLAHPVVVLLAPAGAEYTAGLLREHGLDPATVAALADALGLDPMVLAGQVSERITREVAALAEAMAETESSLAAARAELDQVEPEGLAREVLQEALGDLRDLLADPAHQAPDRLELLSSLQDALSTGAQALDLVTGGGLPGLLADLPPAEPEGADDDSNPEPQHGASPPSSSEGDATPPTDGGTRVKAGPSAAGGGDDGEELAAALDRLRGALLDPDGHGKADLIALAGFAAIDLPVNAGRLNKATLISTIAEHLPADVDPDKLDPADLG